MTPAALHLLVLLVISWIYLTLVRFVDVNEREPVWSLGIAFLLGAAAAGLLSLLIDPVTRVLSPWVGAAAEETAKALAYAACLLIFLAIARIRGWFELSDLVDGIVYGIAIGLGFSAASAFLRDLAFAGSLLAETLKIGPTIVNGALVGLGHGLFGGMTGLGVGLALEAHGKFRRRLLPLLGLVAAIGLNGLFRLLSHGNGFDGQATLLRSWLTVAIPLLGLVAVGLVGLSRERKTIARFLGGEVDSGLVTAEDLALLESFWGRQTRYMGLLASGRLHDCLMAAGRHNRQVQLALAKARIEGEPNGAHVASLTRQVEALRRAVRHASPVILILLLILPLTGAMAIVQDTVPNAGVVRVLGIATPSIDKYWRSQITNYSSPRVAPYSTSSSVCPFQSNNAMFCPPDGNIYYDPAFLNELHDNIGDFAPVVVLAHEWGHKVQSLRGSAQNPAGRWTIAKELQADCYAGEWVRDVERGGNTTRLDKGDVGEALEVLNRGRDPRGNPWYDPHAHGTGGQRVDAFQAGREGISCTSDSLWVEVHLDPAASQQPAAPASGSLLADTPRKRGRFNLVNIEARTNLLTPSRTELIVATYRAVDGSEVQMVKAAYVSAQAALADWRADSTVYLGRGYRVADQGPVKDGEVTVGKWLSMMGEKQIVLLSNRQTYSFVIGPEGIVWEFVTSQAQ